ncbi:MAG: gas vesicle protein GvpG [Gemmatimonadota bacterium]|nr:gas vesicle protein GvpG [Gemmatimonadota bacterium]
MGILSTVLLFPVTGPVAGIRWSLDQVMTVVRQELTDDTTVKQELMELQMLVELGDIDDEEYGRREAQLMQRLRDVRRWREEFGMSTPGGPVRVARGADAGE